MENKMPNNTVKCDICHREFALEKNFLEEKKVTLEKEGLEPTEVTMTILTCPHCGKFYPVIVDDEETTGIVTELRGIVAKEYKAKSKNKTPAPKLVNRHQVLRRKLSFKRKILAGKFNESFYQTEDGKEQLDYHYHV